MFAHEASDICKFDKTCTNNLCSFRQTKVPEGELIEENSDDYNESEENNIEVESCESFGEMFDDIEDLIAYIRPW